MRLLLAAEDVGENSLKRLAESAQRVLAYSNVMAYRPRTQCRLCCAPAVTTLMRMILCLKCFDSVEREMRGLGAGSARPTPIDGWVGSDGLVGRSQAEVIDPD